jgi:dTDP-4-amino-4,6-dideoxygalactose transaminase
MSNAIKFIDLAAQQTAIRKDIDAAIAKVLDHGIYIMGREVAEFEEKMAAFTGAKHCISCANGTDALLLGLMACGVKRDDVIFVPDFTFVATAEVVALLGATPFFVDVQPDTFNMCPQSLEGAINEAKSKGMNIRGIIPVDLFGQTADYEAIQQIADRHGLFVIADAAQSMGASYNDRRAGTWGDIAATSFFPAKPLGCYGDGGAVFTDNDDYATLIRSMRVHGQGTNKYDNVRLGINGRLDTIQAAILLRKLEIFETELAARDQIARRYSEGLGDIMRTPVIRNGAFSAWAQYTLRLPHRDKIADACKNEGIPTFVYYPKPLSAQQGYQSFPRVANDCPIAESLASTVLSLPMHPYLPEDQQDKIISTLRRLHNQSGE